MENKRVAQWKEYEKSGKAPECKISGPDKDGVMEYDLGYAIVRVHPSKMSPEEQRRVYEEAARKLLRAYYKAIKEKGLTDQKA